MLIETNTENVDLLEFAFCGTYEGYENMLKYLSGMAESEIWGFNDEQPYSVLRKYIRNTFSQCYKQNKIIYSSDGNNCAFNTGLLTPNGNDILAFFTKNNIANAQPWFLKGFKDKADRIYMSTFNEVPKLASYTDNYEEFYFNPDNKIEINSDHILDDNWERISSVVPLPKSIVKSMLVGLLDDTTKRIKRNMRLAVPQYYREQIMFLLPIQIPITNTNYVIMALAVEKIDDKRYRANTIFTREMAYEKARLLMKPESNWLI